MTTKADSTDNLCIEYIKILLWVDSLMEKIGDVVGVRLLCSPFDIHPVLDHLGFPPENTPDFEEINFDPNWTDDCEDYFCRDYLIDECGRAVEHGYGPERILSVLKEMKAYLDKEVVQ